MKRRFLARSLSVAVTAALISGCGNIAGKGPGVVMAKEVEETASKEDKTEAGESESIMPALLFGCGRLGRNEPAVLYVMQL